ncbi:MAG: lysostaphin resistance A-like protein [Butyricicoccus sp.]
MEQIDIPQERRYCSKLGFSVLAIMLWSILWQFGLYWLDGWILPFRMPETLYYLLLLVGHYAVSLPIVFCIWRKTPPMPFCRERAGAKRMGRWFVIGCALMWLGSLIGTNINDMVYALTGRDPVGMVDESFSQMPMAAIVLGACIIGPLCEELVFRGLLAGRLARYGQKPGAFISALLFGLYHANLEQFFYALRSVCCCPTRTTAPGLLRTLGVAAHAVQHHRLGGAHAAAGYHSRAVGARPVLDGDAGDRHDPARSRQKTAGLAARTLCAVA